MTNWVVFNSLFAQVHLLLHFYQYGIYNIYLFVAITILNNKKKPLMKHSWNFIYQKHLFNNSSLDLFS